MKIGILTFHWCYNYGAIIQAWALQSCLSSFGHEVFVINYDPTRSQLPWWMVALRQRSLRRFARDMYFHLFRRRHFCETVAVSSIKDIAALSLDAVIVGSDQVWNVQYLTCPSGKYNDVYLLHGSLGETKKLTYAASIGHGGWRDYRWKDDLIADIRAFDSISVREAVACDELAAFGVISTLVPDPTLLLKVKDYEKITRSKKTKKPYIFSYLLSEYDKVLPMVEHVSRETHKDFYVVSPSHLKESEFCFLDPCKWLSALRYSSFVVTDSFHGTMLSLIFNVPFATVLKPGAPKMNSRVTGLLNAVGLGSRIASSVSDIIAFMNNPINWSDVNGRIDKMRAQGCAWLTENLR